MILSLGCSHSNGPYYENDMNDLDHDSWPKMLAKRVNEKYRHIAAPGNGILTYYEILKQLEEQNLLHLVDKLLIQHTQELRIIISYPDPNDIYEEIENKVFDMFTTNSELPFIFTVLEQGTVMNLCSTTSLTSKIFEGVITESKPDTKTKLFITEMFQNLHSLLGHNKNGQNIFNLTHAEIIRMCERNNIKLYEFAWDWSGTLQYESTKHLNYYVPIVHNDKFFILKEFFTRRLAKEAKIDYNKKNSKTLENMFENYLNFNGHFLLSGEIISHEIIVDILNKQGFFDV